MASVAGQQLHGQREVPGSPSFCKAAHLHRGPASSGSHAQSVVRPHQVLVVQRPAEIPHRSILGLRHECRPQRHGSVHWPSWSSFSSRPSSSPAFHEQERSHLAPGEGHRRDEARGRRRQRHYVFSSRLRGDQLGALRTGTAAPRTSHSTPPVGLLDDTAAGASRSRSHHAPRTPPRHPRPRRP